MFEGFSLKSLFYFVAAFFEGFKSIIGNQQTLQGAGLPHYSHKRYIQRDSHNDNSPRLQSNQEAKPTQPEHRQLATTK